MADRILNVLELHAALTDADLEALVHGFYGRVQQDPLLGPVFAARIADDARPVHLDTMVRFWSTILRGTNRYHGNPMLAHAVLGPMGVASEHFARWLELFREVAEEVLPQGIAASVAQRAERMAPGLERVVASAAG